MGTVLTKTYAEHLIAFWFLSLQSVGLNKTIAPELLPVLNETSRPFVLSSSFWMDGPIRKQTSVTKNNNENTIKAEKSAERITEIIEDDTLEGPTANDASNSLTNHDWPIFYHKFCDPYRYDCDYSDEVSFKYLTISVLHAGHLWGTLLTQESSP